MKQTKKITLAALLAALAAAIMLCAYFPYLTYAVPALAGGVMVVAVIELSGKWAWLAYGASVLPVALFAENEAKLLYLLFFGYYPIVKSLLERLHSRVAEYVLKLTLFNAVVAVYGWATVNLLGIPMEEIPFLGQYGIAVLWAAANLVFLLYDVALSRAIAVYMWRLHPQIKKWFL